MAIEGAGSTARTRVGADIVRTVIVYAALLFAVGWIQAQLAWLMGWLPVLGAVAFVAWRHRRRKRALIHRSRRRKRVACTQTKLTRLHHGGNDMPMLIAPRVLSWATDLDDKTADQAARSAELPFVFNHVALMPDAHFGYGATVGSVIPTQGAIIPSAVGVDIGCGMIAAGLDLTAGDLPDDLKPLHTRISRAVPAGRRAGSRPNVGDP